MFSPFFLRTVFCEIIIGLSLIILLSGCGGSSDNDDDMQGQNEIPCTSQGTSGVCTVVPACHPGVDCPH